MTKTLSSSLLITLAALAAAASARTPASGPNEAATARHYASLIAGAEPKTAELVLFFSQMPKGGDLHHHYSGAIYAETYVDWLDKQGYCVNKLTYKIETDRSVVEHERAKQPKDRACLSSSDVYADDATWRELLQRWSSKDFNNHGAIQPPPDRQFFQTFGYFGPISDRNFHEGLVELKNRALAENVAYIETMFKSPDTVSDPEFDKRAWDSARDEAKFVQLLESARQKLSTTPAFRTSVDNFVRTVNEAALGIVGVNIVGQESQMVSMRDYTLHMQMFRYLKKVYPKVNVAMHAGELALGDVPPEDLKYHIDQALNVAGAQRIGHGIDLAHETNAVGIMKTMRAKDIPVEINLTSNSFIEGVKGENHPITLYRKYGVPYVISTDDAGVTRHNLANEYVLFASRYKPSYAEVKKASYNSIRYSFLPESDKQRLTRLLDARFARFESDVAALERTAVKH
jgi:adenosine deaminase/adenosine deaminase CECR1